MQLHLRILPSNTLAATSEGSESYKPAQPHQWIALNFLHKHFSPYQIETIMGCFVMNGFSFSVTIRLAYEVISETQASPCKWCQIFNQFFTVMAKTQFKIQHDSFQNSFCWMHELPSSIDDEKLSSTKCVIFPRFNLLFVWFLYSGWENHHMSHTFHLFSKSGAVESCCRGWWIGRIKKILKFKNLFLKIGMSRGYDKPGISREKNRWHHKTLF